MKRRIVAGLLIMLLLLCSSSSSFACDDNQTDIYLGQVLFGDNALSKANDDNVKILQNALFLCSEQCDGQGQEKIDFLDSKKVSGVPKLEKIDIKSDDLMECSHKSWEYEYADADKAQAARKKLLQKSVNEVFDFGFISNHFGSGKGKCNSFSALLYYTHILSDYLADNPTESEVYVDGKIVPAYTGSSYTTINGDKPSFTKTEKKLTISTIKYSNLDKQKRAGSVFSVIGPDTIASIKTRDSNAQRGIWPTGITKQKSYSGIVPSGFIYEKCHILGHQLGGQEVAENFFTGTWYLNHKGMEELESRVAKYVKDTDNHVLYKATPVFQGDNKIASGIQIEAYSIEDKGEGICCNRYYYNVQPGIVINYANGDNEMVDMISNSEKGIPFAVENADENNPDLIFEMNKHLEILFEEQQESNTYTLMMNNIKTIANEARTLSNDNPATKYLSLKKYEYQYLDVLKSSIPILLEKEEFFKSAFK